MRGFFSWRTLWRGRGAQRINLVFAHMFVGARAFEGEQLRVFCRQRGDDFVIGARRQHLVDRGKAHHALRDVDAVTDDVGLVVDVLDQAHGAQVDAGAQ